MPTDVLEPIIEESLSESDEGFDVFELFLADGETSIEDDSGLIWKDVLREGQWAYRPGPGQKPVPVPLKVTPGNATDSKEIGMADLIDAFEDEAIDHVTVPTSHEDRADENTGFVRQLKIVDRDGKKVLRAGIEFTELDVKGKAQRGTIANTSVGVIFDYVKKSTGKMYRQALGHVALTNKPWINGMKPFGVAASDEFQVDERSTFLLEDVIWDRSKSLNWLRNQVGVAVNQYAHSQGDTGTQCFVMDVMPSKALVTKLGLNGNEDNFVVPFQIRSGEVKVSGPDKWIKASKEWVTDSSSLSEEHEGEMQKLSSQNQRPNVRRNDDETQGGNAMGSKTSVAEETDSGVSEETKDEIKPEQNLSEETRKLIEEAQTKAKEEVEAKFAEQAEETSKLRNQLHEKTVDERVEQLKKEGYSSGTLKEVRSIMLADQGKEILTLSETPEGKEEAEEVKLSASEIVERVLTSIPEDARVKLAEQASEHEDFDKPKREPDKTNLDERVADVAADLGRDMPKDGE